jgi:hypothetical protein
MMTYPEGLIKSTVHAAAISVHLFIDANKLVLFGHIYFPSWEKLFSQLEKKIFLGIKKACG